MLGIEEPNARQLVGRARKHIANGRRASVTAEEQKRLLGAFLAAARDGDQTALKGLFAADIVSWSDGGGVVRAARSPVTGRDRVARFIVAVSPHFWDGVMPRTIEANGRAAVLVTRDGAVVSLVTVAASSEGIDQILWMLRPSKLAAVSGRKAT